MPYIIQVAGGRLKKLKVFGDDYPTVDGNGVSDYIYVCDLAEGHVAALEKLEPGVRICNPGTGRGTSELELIKTFGEVKGLKLDYEIAGRRPAEGKTPGAGFYGPGYRSPNPPRMAAVFS